MAMVKKGEKALKKPRPKNVSAGTARVRQLTRKQTKEKLKKEAKKQAPIPSSFRLTRQTLSILRFWKPLGGIFLVYLVLNVIFTTGFISDLHTTAGNISSSHNVSNALHGFGSLLGSGTSGAQNSSAAQSILLVLESLVIIWALRRLLAAESVGVKQAYYQSMTPLIPFVLVVAVIILQLLPVTLGAAVLELILASAFVAGTLLTVVFAILFSLLAAWSLRMISSSVFALYIVTLPDMQPRQALRSAKNLVRFRRLAIVRRLLFLPICVLLLMGVVMLPIILFVPFLVVPVFFVLTMLVIIFMHTYLYSLYRGLIE